MPDHFRRLPVPEDGKAVWVQPGGVVEQRALQLEDRLMGTARTDAQRALRLCADETVSRAELRMALRFSVAQLGRVADIA